MVERLFDHQAFIDNEAVQIYKDVLISPKSEKFINFKSQSSWKLLRQEPLKLTATNDDLNLFVKAYAPGLGDYPEMMLNALIAASSINFPVRILPPIGYSNGIIFFNKGETRELTRYDRLYKIDEMHLLNAVAISHGIDPLPDNSTLGLVEVDGTKYAVDPFDDGWPMVSYYDTTHF